MLSTFTVALLALGQVFPGSSGGMCSLDPATSPIATAYRATATTGTAFQSDAVLECAFDTGPGARNCVGTNVSGEILLGPGSGSGTFVRVFGTYQGLSVIAQDFTASNTATIAAAIFLGTNAYIQNSNAAKPVRVNDLLQIDAVTTMEACAVGYLNSLRPFNPGAESTERTRLCFCTSDNAVGVDTYRWQNVVTGTVGGTDTECPL